MHRFLLRFTVGLLFLCMSSISLFAQDVNGDGFHDGDVAVLKQILTDNPANTLGWAGDNYGSWFGATWNADSPKRVVMMDVRFKNIRSLNISGLTELVQLNCSDNYLTTIDVSALKKLTKMFCSNNDLKTIDIDKNTLLNIYYANNAMSFSAMEDFADLVIVDGDPQDKIFEEFAVGLGQAIDFSSEANIAGVATTFKWYKNGVLVPGETSATYTPTETGTYYSKMENTKFSGIELQTNNVTVVNDDLNDGFFDDDVETLEYLLTINPGHTLNWTGTNYGTWEGVTWSTDPIKKVIELDISGKNISKLHFNAFNELAVLKCSDNNIANLPIVGKLKLKTIDCRNNLLPFTGITDVLYITNPVFTAEPQKKLFEIKTIVPGTEIDYSSQETIASTATVYEWYKDGVKVDGVTTSKYSPADEGVYYCKMTNSKFPGLTLITNNITVSAAVTYNAADVNALKAILTDNPAHKLTSWTGDDYSTWSGITWNTANPKRVTKLQLDDKGLVNVDASAFAELTDLNVEFNSITSLNVANLTNLTKLTCKINKLTALNLTGCDKLRDLNVDNNELTSLSINNLTLLERLEISANKLSSIDLSNQTKLWHLIMSDNEFETIDLSSNPMINHLVCSNNKLPFTVLKDFISVAYYRYSPQLRLYEERTIAPGIEIDYSSQENIDGTATVYEWFKDGAKIDGVTTSKYTPTDPGVYTCNMTNTKLPGLTLSTNEVTVVAVTDNYNSDDVNALKAILTANPGNTLGWAGEDYSAWAGVTWNIEDPRRVTGLSIENKNITNVDVTAMAELREFDCSNNTITTVNVTNLSKLETLDCGYNDLTAIDLTGLSALKILNVAKNKLDNIDLSPITDLINLNIGLNKFTSIDISKFNNLTDLVFNNNQIESIDLTGKSKLVNLNFNSNLIRDIDLTDVTSLNQLICTFNKLPFSQLVKGLSVADFQYISQRKLYDRVFTFSGIEIDLSKEETIDGTATVFTWYKNRVKIDGHTASKYTPTEAGQYYCEMTNPKFPGLTLTTEKYYVSDPAGATYDTDDVAALQAILTANPANTLTTWTGTSYHTWEGVTWNGDNPRRVIQLDVTSKGLVNLNVEALPKLKQLYCSDNDITTLSVKNLSELINIQCSNAKLTTVDLTGVTNITDINFSNNEITAIEIQLLTKLERVYIYSNDITALNITPLKDLKELDIRGNELKTLDITGLTALTKVHCQENKLPLSALKAFLPIADFQFNPQKNVFEASQQIIGYEIDYSAEADVNGTATVFEWYDKDDAKIAGATAAKYTPAATGFYYCKMTNTEFAGLTITTAKTEIVDAPVNYNNDDVNALKAILAANPANTLISWTGDTYNTWAGVTWNTEDPRRVIGLDITNKGIVDLNVESLPELQELTCSDNAITSLSVKNLGKLTKLISANTRLTSVNLTGLTKLEELNLTNNSLTTVDLAALTAMQKLYLGDNTFAALNISTLTALKELVITSNSLKNIDITGITGLVKIHCENNSLPISVLKPMFGTADFQYSPQGTVFAVTQIYVGAEIDYSAEADVDGTATVFEWYKDGAKIDGVTTAKYSPADIGDYHCIMTNAKLPGLTITTAITEVIDAPVNYDATDVAALKKILTDNPANTLTDWTGDSYKRWSGVTWNSEDPKRVTAIDIKNKGITTLDAKPFAELTELLCSQNTLSTLSVTNLAKLVKLEADGCGLTTIDLTGLVKAEEINLANNTLSAVNLTGLSALKKLYFANNGITSLDISALTALTELDVTANKLTSINITGVGALVKVINKENNLPLSELKKFIGVADYQYTPQKVVFDPVTKYLDYYTIDYSAEADVNGTATVFEWYKDGTKIAGVTTPTYKPTALGDYHCVMTNAELTGLTITTAVTKIVEKPPYTLEDADVNALKKILRDNPDNTLTWSGEDYLNYEGVVWSDEDHKRILELHVGQKKLVTIDLTGVTELRKLVSYGNNISTLTTTGQTKLTYINVNGNRIASLDVSHLALLEQLHCNSNDMAILNTASLAELRIIDARKNKLASLNLTAAEKLVHLNATWNDISDLQMGSKPALQFLDISLNKLTTLDITGFTAIEELNCNNNMIESLDPSSCAELNTFNCSNNKLSTIDVTALTKLKRFICSYNNIKFTGLKLADPGSYINLTYAPQYKVFDNSEIIEGTEIDYSTEEVIEGVATTYAWYKDDVLVDGATTSKYTPEGDCKIHCVLRNTKFPKLALTTRIVTVKKKKVTPPPPPTDIDSDEFGEVIIYPNPTTGQFKVEIPDIGDANVTVTIINISGHVMRNIRFESDVGNNIDISGFSSGVYTVIVRASDGRQTSRRIIKQ